jgi:hypothetical protein
MIGDNANSRRVFTKWWKESTDIPASVFNTFRQIDDVQSYRTTSNRRWLAMYQDERLGGSSGVDHLVDELASRITINITRSVIDAAVAHLATNRPKPQFLTVDGQDSFKSKAKGLNDFAAGQFYYNRIYEKCLDIFRDAAVFGTGFIKIYADFERGEVIAERVFPQEIVVDERDGRMGEPRTLYQYKEVDREVLLTQFPEKEGDIMLAGLVRDSEFERDDYVADPVSVIESWHLPSGPDAKDGRRVICVDSGCLEDEEWTSDKFPFAKFTYMPPSIGYYGSGLCEQLQPIQGEINYLVQKIQHLMTLATSQVWIENGSDINVAHLDNEDFGIRTYTGRPPIVLNMQAVSPEYFSHLDRLHQRAFEVAGINQLHAQGQKPAGLNSGKALREFSDTASKRFLHLSQRWEQFHMDIAHRMIDAARELDEHLEGGYSLMAHGKNSVRKLNFKQIDLEKDKYVIRVFPTNFLSDTPSGKIADIQDLVQVDPSLGENLIGLLDFPDLDSVVSTKTARTELVDRLLEMMLEKGQKKMPETYYPFDLIFQKMPLAILRAQLNGVPDERIELVRKFLNECERIQEREQQQAQPMPQQGAEGVPPEPQQMQPGALPAA